MNTKQCTKCNEVKEVSEFTKHAKNKDGLENHCKSCRSAYRTSGKGKALKVLYQTQQRRKQMEKELGETIPDSLTVYEVALLQGETECAYCEADLTPDNVQLDHVIPLSHGGANEYQNIVACCRSCNSKKRDRLFVEFLQDHCDRQTEYKFIFMLAQRYSVEIGMPKFENAYIYRR